MNMDKIKDFFESIFRGRGSDFSGIRKTNNYYRNLQICDRMHKKEMAKKKEEARLEKEMLKLNKKRKK